MADPGFLGDILESAVPQVAVQRAGADGVFAVWTASEST
jgi:hypothetical protein